jgi:undecaprenyl-diphosphatase
MDIAITHWINSFAGQSAVFDQLILDITNFGVPIMVVLVVMQWWVASPRPTARQNALKAGLTFLLGLGLAQLMLLFIHRMRPYDAGISHLIVPPTVDWSFPSDHAIASLGIVFAYAFSAFRRQTFLFLILAALICFSRIFVGMHYVSDVLGGAGVAFVAAALVKRFYPAGSKLKSWLVQLF